MKNRFVKIQCYEIQRWAIIKRAIQYRFCETWSVFLQKATFCRSIPTNIYGDIYFTELKTLEQCSLHQPGRYILKVILSISSSGDIVSMRYVRKPAYHDLSFYFAKKDTMRRKNQCIPSIIMLIHWKSRLVRHTRVTLSQCIYAIEMCCSWDVNNNNNKWIEFASIVLHRIQKSRWFFFFFDLSSEMNIMQTQERRREIAFRFIPGYRLNLLIFNKVKFSRVDEFCFFLIFFACSF